MSDKKLIRDFGAIFSSEVVLLAASFISFPIFTRILTKSDYGFMSLITMSLMLIGNVSSGGLNNSILRFYGRHGEIARSIFINTMRTATLGLAVLGTAVYLFVAWVAYSLGALSSGLFFVVAFAASLIIIRALTKVELCFLRVSDHIMLMNVFNILTRYGGIGASIWLIYKYKSLYSLYVGTLVAELAVLLIIYTWFFLEMKELKYYPRYSKPVSKEAFIYGLPLAINGLLSIVISSTDRYVIGFFLNVEKVADYTVAVNYCNFPIEILRNVFLATFVPMIMNSWNKHEKGEREEAQLLTKFIASYCWLAVPIVFGLILTDTEGIKLLAGSKYVAIPYLVPLLAAAFALNGMSFVYLSGLLYKKKTMGVLYLNIFTGVINLFLNLVLVSWIGVYGAAIGTLISYVLFIIAASYFSRRELSFTIPVNDIVLSICAGIFMAITVVITTRYVNVSGLLFIKIAIGVFAYGAFVLVFAPSKIRLLHNAFRPSST